MNTAKKRKLDSNAPEGPGKRLRMTSLAEPTSTSNPTPPPPEQQHKIVVESSQSAPLVSPKSSPNDSSRQGNEGDPATREKGPAKRRAQIKKLKPIRPYPTVPASVSATGPRSAHREGKNTLCLTRKTPLGAYMRRCKDIIIKDGYKQLHLSAMGAAIPLLIQLVCALPPILPFAQDDIHTEITTGSLEVQDEIIPDDEDEDISYQTRSKSTLNVVFRIGDGEFEGVRGAVRRFSAGKTAPKNPRPPLPIDLSKRDVKGKGKTKTKDITTDVELVYEEPEQEEML